MTRGQVVDELVRLETEIARRSLLGFTKHTFPGFKFYWHHAQLAQHLDAVAAGTLKRLMVFMPPQHGKTELASRRMPAYLLGRNPDMRVVFGTYNHVRANEVGRDVQRIVDSEAYRGLFPGTRLATGRDIERRTATRFDIVGRAGYFAAAGVGERIAGKSMDIGIIDDPVGSRADAESETIRANIWDWFNNDIMTRSQGTGTRAILIMTRWHEDDLAGRLLRIAREDPRADQWQVISLPAICEEEQPGDPRKVGEALWPERFPVSELEKARARGIYEFSGLYQQRPVPAGGSLARREWFPVLPEKLARGNVVRWCRGWDLAATVPDAKKKDPDWTAGVLVGECGDGRWLIADVARTRATPNEVDRLMKSVSQMDPYRALIREEQVSASGKAVVAAHAKLFAGKDYEGVTIGSTSKKERWRPLLAQAEAGNVVLDPGPWNRDFIDEMITLPHGLHDDQADAAALAFNELIAYKDYGPSAAVVMPSSHALPLGDRGEWRRHYFR